MSPRRKKGQKRYAGYVLLIALYLGWFKLGLNPGVLALLSGLTVFYGLFAAPLPCCAINRDGTLCRRNAYGLLVGCSLQQHKWQKFAALVRRQSWAQFGSRIFRGVAGNAAALTVVAGFASVVATLVVPLLAK